MCDVDHFKAYNDSQGHVAGDAALRTIASTFNLVARLSDSVYRYGGEEFLIVLPEEHPSGALIGVERLRRSVENLALPHPSSPAGIITLSVGIAGYDPVARPQSARSSRRPTPPSTEPISRPQSGGFVLSRRGVAATKMP